MPGIPTFSSTSHLTLPPTSATFWLYVSSALLSHSLETVLSGSTSNPSKRFTFSSITTCLAQFQHVIGSIMSSADNASIKYFDHFLREELNLDVGKIEARRQAMRRSLKECLTSLIEEHPRARYTHPAVREARELLKEMDDEDRMDELRQFQKGIIKRRHSGVDGQSFFLDVEEYVLRMEFLAFKKGCVGPNGRGPAVSARLSCPPLIRSLRVYHDGGLSVDSKQAFTQQQRPTSPRMSRPRFSSIHYQADVPARRMSAIATSPSCKRNSTMSFLERQFLEALESPNTSPRQSLSHKRPSLVAPDVETLVRQTSIRRPQTTRFWSGDWESEDEDEFYREALRYEPKH